ncbi:helix-turn-helix transcriptional regulator (plasmid) [Clostridium estertheticum]|uniref:helix-turn-helix domain-containing protein n=1 Tax=Clostridium estertheticum TaxID=238834 RepID=UPI001C7D3BDF|nr:helix-turn-helix transcriptional regulator [Clostridium estertheticum]MBX4259708.1 helix-turn-helix transcriptional regulator [Clostridium estertheticum]WLC73295.1 helix-turn-helix transcriptional regulator [Clostridium estertheticum]
MRHLHNMTQTELAKKTGLSQSYISKLSLELKSPTLEVVALIATALNICPFELMEVVLQDNEYLE